MGGLSRMNAAGLLSLVAVWEKDCDLLSTSWQIC